MTVSGTIELDLCGLRCPLPLLKIKQALRGLQQDKLLRVWLDDEGSLKDVPLWLATSTHQLVTNEQADKGVCLLIRCGGSHQGL